MTCNSVQFHPSQILKPDSESMCLQLSRYGYFITIRITRKLNLRGFWICFQNCSRVKLNRDTDIFVSRFIFDLIEILKWIQNTHVFSFLVKLNILNFVLSEIWRLEEFESVFEIFLECNWTELQKLLYLASFLTNSKFENRFRILMVSAFQTYQK